MKRGFSQIVIMAVVVGLIVGIGATFAYFQLKSKPALQPPPVSQSSPISKISPSLAAFSDETANWNIYTSPNKIFTLKYPPELTATAQGEGVLSTVSPWNNTFTKPSDYKVEFSQETKAQGESLKDFANRIIKQRSGQVYNQSSLIPDSQKSLTINGHEALWYVGNLGPAIKHVEVYILKDETDVVGIQLWDNNQPPTVEHQNILNQILSTFKFI